MKTAKDAPKTRIWRTRSPEETIGLGRLIAKDLHPGNAVALTGDLGSGKTTLVKGLALGLGVPDPDRVRSPTFVIFHMYKGRVPLYHFDLYRLDETADLTELGLEEYLADPHAVSVVEWADRVPRVSRLARFEIKISRTGKMRRSIRLLDRSR